MSAFGKAFNAARNGGKSTFSFGGKSYNTKVAATTPKKGPVPASRPDTVKTASAPKAPERSGVGKALNAMANSSSVGKYISKPKKHVQGPQASAKTKTPSAKDYPANMSSRKSVSNDQARYNMAKAPLSIADRINRQATTAIQSGLAAAKKRKK